MKAFEYARGRYTDTVTSEIKFAVGTPDRLGSNLLWCYENDGNPRGVFVDRDTLCYGTGFVDKNGKDIYTGDILQSFDPTCPVGQLHDVGKVVWLDEEAAFFVEMSAEQSTERTVEEIIFVNRHHFKRLTRRNAKLYTIKEETENE